MRKIGVGTPGGAEALAIFHQLLYDEKNDRLTPGGQLARIKVDEKNCFGMIERQAVREASSSAHGDAAARKRVFGDVDGRNARKHSRAERSGHPSLDWRERPGRGTATASRPRGQIAGIGKLPA